MSLDPVVYTDAIGLSPGTNSKSDENHLAISMSQNPSVTAAVNNWLVAQGLPEKTVRSALLRSKATAYVSTAYLKSWRSRVNPSWDLLRNDLDDDDGWMGDTPTTGTDAARSNPPAQAAQAAQVPDSAATEKWLKDLYGQINLAVEQLLKAKLDATTLKLDPAAKAQIEALARESAKAQIVEQASPRTIEVRNITLATVTSLGLQHERFPILLRAVQAKDHKNFRLNVWLTGPTGSGKTSACEAAAKALSLPFGSDGSLDADYKVLGFRDANGNIISTQFLDMYENGGIYVADEIDNWMPSALLSLNAALANGWVSSPRGIIKRHSDCCVIACANTWGLGATSEYVGRTRLDAASLDRFQPKIDWPYDERLERAIAHNMAGDIGTDWFTTVANARAKARTNGLKVIISPRATYSGISLLNAGFDRNDVIDMTICAGIAPEQKLALGIAPAPTQNAPKSTKPVSFNMSDTADNYATAYRAMQRAAAGGGAPF
jgi:hypothetical protein